MPYFVWRQLKNFKEFTFHIDGIACYAPSIFFAPLITNLKKKYNCKCYLILRDLFPQWAVDLGLMKNGSIVHKFFQHIEKNLFKASDMIGVQSKGNLRIVQSAVGKNNKTIEVFDNCSPQPEYHQILF